MTIRSSLLLMAILVAGIRVSQAESESPAQHEVRTTVTDAWEKARFGRYPEESGPALDAFETKLNQYRTAMWSDFQKLLEDDKQPNAQKAAVLHDYIALRDRWISSESIGNSVLAGLITMGVDAVIGRMARNSLEHEEELPAEFKKVHAANRLSALSAFEHLDPIIDAMGVQHDHLAALCGSNMVGRLPCWEDYVAQFGLRYSRLKVDASATSIFLDPELEDDTLPLDGKMLALITTVRNPFLIIRQGEPAYFVFFWAHVLDDCAMTDLFLNVMNQVRGATSTLREVGSFAGPLLDARGPAGRRWLGVEYEGSSVDDFFQIYILLSGNQTDYLEAILSDSKRVSLGDLEKIKNAFRLKR